MAGHSKWANIKHRKQAVDAKKGAVYAQLSKEISVAARLGGSDPNFNFRLRNAVDRAREVGMPSDNIQRAIDKFKQKEGNFEEIIYEGYGPAGIAVLVEAATDNRNRTASELRLIFTKSGGNLGESGCVSWSFKHVGLISLSVAENKNLTEDFLLEIISEHSVEDYSLDNEFYFIMTSVESLESVLRALRAAKLNCSGELSYIAINQVQITESETWNTLEKLLLKLEENDDVQKVYHNASLS